jgi:mono/diheme cytochrome c family protein
MTRALAILALPVMLGGCQDWLTDFVQQPSVGTWQKFSADSLTGETTPFRGMPQGSVPVTGVTVAEWEVSYNALPFTVDSLSGVRNPVPVDGRSLANGQRLYSVNCAVCHGDAGDSNSPIKRLNPIMGSTVLSLVAPSAVGRTDGYIWGMMRNGRGLMASYNRIPEQERWDVVNYVRGLQGRYPVRQGAVAFAGEASAFGGHTVIGPTMPSAYVRPSTAGMVPKAEHATATDSSRTGGH